MFRFSGSSFEVVRLCAGWPKDSRKTSQGPVDSLTTDVDKAGSCIDILNHVHHNINNYRSFCPQCSARSSHPAVDSLFGVPSRSHGPHSPWAPARSGPSRCGRTRSGWRGNPPNEPGWTVSHDDERKPTQKNVGDLEQFFLRVILEATVAYFSHDRSAICLTDLKIHIKTAEPTDEPPERFRFIATAQLLGPMNGRCGVFL